MTTARESNSPIEQTMQVEINVDSLMIMSIAGSVGVAQTNSVIDNVTEPSTGMVHNSAVSAAAEEEDGHSRETGLCDIFWWPLPTFIWRPTMTLPLISHSTCSLEILILTLHLKYHSILQLTHHCAFHPSHH